MNRPRPWLLSLATIEQVCDRGPDDVRYSPERQLTMVETEGGEVIPAVSAGRPVLTKKADIEKSEDQKDRWTA